MAKRILCIEDDREMRTSIRLMLEIAGYEIEEAENGKTGVDLALKMFPDLIICDIMMPGLDGYETLKEIRKHESTALTPFIFLTGEDPRSHLRKGMNLGASDFLTKPVDMDDFLKAVSVRLEEAEHRKTVLQRTINELSEKITRALPHELRTPMTGILGLTELLHTHVEQMTPQDIKELAQLLSDSAARMNQTLEKFWIHTQCLLLPNDHATLSASRQRGSKEAHLVIQRIAEVLASSYNRSYDLRLNLSPVSLAIAEHYLEQLLQQVIDNAFKFSVTGTNVAVSTACEHNRGLITITDHGRGMSEDQIKKIHTFMQFDREQYEQQGLGLGLMIAQRLTEIHGGTFRVTSTSGEGTSIELSFPLVK